MSTPAPLDDADYDWMEDRDVLRRELEVLITHPNGIDAPSKRDRIIACAQLAHAAARLAWIEAVDLDR